MSASNVYSPVTDISLNNTSEKLPLHLEPSIDVPFWSEDPNILFQSLEFFPVDSMTYNQNLNAISRLVILFTVFGLVFTRNVRLLFIGGITLVAIYILHTINASKTKTSTENFSTVVKTLFNNNLPSSSETFMESSSQNPFSNVLMTDYDYNPNKKPAPPSYIGDTILEQAKKTVVELNPGQPDIADKLFRDLGEQLVFEQSLRPFYSNASTTIPNDQQAFAEFCYGSMISCKEGNPFACARNLSRHTNV